MKARAPAPQRLRVVRPDLLEVPYPETRVARHRPRQRGQRRDQTAGEDVALDPVRRLAVARPAPIGDEDRLHARETARPEHAVDRREERAVLPVADRLQHLDRGDLADAPVHLAVVLLANLDVEAGRARPRDPGLLGRDREAGDACAVLARRDPRKGAPAAADLEQVVVGPQAELVADATELPELRIRESLVLALEDGAGVRHRLVEHRREELVPEVVVVGDVAPRAAEAVPAVRSRPGLEDPPDARVPLGRGLGVDEEKLEERRQIVGRPLPGGVRLAQPELAAGGDPPEETAVVDREPDGRARAEAAHRAVGELDLERPALEVRERALEDRDGHALQQPPARARLGPQAALERRHDRTEPSPGTNGGLRWNGTRLRQRRRACQWISPVTCSGWIG